MYKRTLQELCQKKKWALPDYTTNRDGPDHCPTFQSTVTVGALSFQGPSNCRSAKEAHSEAAKLALDHFASPPTSPPLPPSGDESLKRLGENADSSMVQVDTEKQSVVVDTSIYKSKLLMLCQKKQWSLPKYDTAQDGPSHNPCFQATVTVGDLSFEGPPYCRSAKKAQGEAAKIAYDHFIATPKPSVIDSGSPEADSSNSVNDAMLNATVVPQTSDDPLKEPMRQNSNILIENGIPCKNQLQTYAQKRNMNLPSYEYIREGSIHAFRYRAKVTVGGQTFECPQFSSSQKEAENAVARVALITLFAEGDPEDDPVFYKNLLLELIKKEGLSNPVYVTISEGPSHLATFTSTVQIEDETFKGDTAKSKKKAEQHAAKVAWTTLKERKECRPSHGFASDFVMFDEIKAISIASPTTVDMYKQQASSINNNQGNDDDCDHDDKPGNMDMDIDAQASISLAAEIPDVCDSLSEMQLKPTCLPVGNEGSDAAASKNLTTPTSALSTCSMSQFTDQTNIDPGSTSHPQRNARTPTCKRIQVYPRRPTLKLPEGAKILPISDDKWIAVEIEPATG